MNFAAITEGLSAAIPPIVGGITLIALSMFAVRFSRYAYDQIMSFLAPRSENESAPSFDLRDLSGFEYINDEDAEELRSIASSGGKVTYQDVYLLNLTNRLEVEDTFERQRLRDEESI